MKDSTKYEQARIIGARALQISMGAPFMVNISSDELKNMGYNPIEIAKLEFKQGVIPIEVKRQFPTEVKKESEVKAFDQTKME